MTMERTLGRASCKAGCRLWSSSSTIETSEAAPPPTPLKRATIWGMAVMCTRRAAIAPMGTPTRIPTRVITRPAVVKWRRGRVAARAMAMPTAAV